jgi:5-methylcytosine-specific restriction endonuclease McrA
MRGANRRQCGSLKCTRRYNAERSRGHMHERRARLRGNEWERFNPIDVYERDGWLCGICGDAVDRLAKAPEPFSVSLDHIVPVSLGGPHTQANTRCAHLICNTRRGNRAA